MIKCASFSSAHVTVTKKEAHFLGLKNTLTNLKTFK